MMPPPVHLSDIYCKCFLYRRCRSKQKGAMNQWTNDGVCVGCWKILL